MNADHLAAAIAEVRKDFAVESAQSAADRDDVFRLRYQIYCVERNFEPGRDGREMDEFDEIARHAIIRRRSDGTAVGTVRVIPPACHIPGRRFPLEQAGRFPQLQNLPLARTAEISRFALSRAVTEGDRPAVLRLCLIRAVFMLSGELGLTHWCALMDPALLRLLRFSSIHFHPMGALVEYHGLRQPSWGDIAEVLERVHRERPVIWDFISEHGTLWTKPEERQWAVA
ncbi:MAG TPA: GNAT family N-acyltransferase [Acetobacteraceae bacterium]|nr:GNAT family N-acyltransferase [Acetobacteraceae bacterium]